MRMVEAPDEGAVIGWVHGTAIGLSALGPYVAELASSPAGVRLGIPDRAGVLAGPDHSKADALRTWAVKALLVDSLLRFEAARLEVDDPTSAADWLARLDAAGELSGQAPSEAEARAYYLANLRRFEVREARRVRHVLVADRAVAQRLLGTASGPGALARLASHVSVDHCSRGQGGDLGWVERGHLAGPLEEAIFAAEPGRVTGPVASAFGWHIIVVEAVRAAGVRPFADCCPEIQAELAEYRRRRSWLAWLEQRLAEAVRVPAGAEHPLSRGLPGSLHRH